METNVFKVKLKKAIENGLLLGEMRKTDARVARHNEVERLKKKLLKKNLIFKMVREAVASRAVRASVTERSDSIEFRLGEVKGVDKGWFRPSYSYDVWLEAINSIHGFKAQYVSVPHYDPYIRVTWEQI